MKDTGGSEPATVHHAELWGLREIWDRNPTGEKGLAGGKYHWLLSNDIQTTEWTYLEPQAPFYLFKPQDIALGSEYDGGWKITDVFPMNSVGIVTARDALTIRWSEENVWDIVRNFVKLPEHEAREKYNLGEDVQDWKVEWAQQDVKESGPDRNNIVPLLYRPFDTRFSYYTGKARGLICRPRHEVMRHMLDRENLALVTTRQTRDQWDCLATRSICGHKSCAAYDINTLFPLYLYPDPEEDRSLFANGTDRHVNLSPKFLEQMGKRLRLSFVVEGTGDLKKTFGPEDVFNYIYAVFHSPTYRMRYAEFLRIDFPRVPLTADKKLLRALCSRGKELVALHLLESPKVSRSITRYPVPGDDRVAKGHPRYVPPGEAESGTGKPLKKGRVYISPDAPKSGTKGQYFEGVPPEVWEFHIGGYQVCEKWLKDRRGRNLSYDDLTHYQKVVVALKETIRLMEEIDAAVPDWPIR
ncbi:MAG: helicase [Planctomycetes bacterium]|nr:helicase [Planctomycetota bacterium]